jgi:hypothetical protein
MARRLTSRRTRNTRAAQYVKTQRQIAEELHEEHEEFHDDVADINAAFGDQDDDDDESSNGDSAPDDSSDSVFFR